MSNDPLAKFESGKSAGARSRNRMAPQMVVALFVLIAAVYVAHQDFWNWSKPEPWVFGFLPIGLAYHAAYSIVRSVLMAILVQMAWPRHLEETESSSK